MKYFLLGAAMLTIAFGVSAETKQALTLHMASGTNIVYFLDTEPSIGLKGQDMVVTVVSESTNIPMQNVKRWEIGLAEYGSVNDISNTNNIEISIYGNNITVHNPDSHNIIIYNMSGQIVATGNQIEALFTMPKGIYVIKIANNTYKIAIR